MTRRLRSLVVGTGFWAEQHLRAYQRCREVAVCGLVGHANATRLEEVAARHGVPHHSMNLKRAIRDLAPDMVDICAAPAFRLAGVRACAGTGVRLVNLEKPMALTPGEATRIEALCRKTGLLLTVNHQKKFNKPWVKAHRLVRSGALGPIRFFRATCRGNMLEQGTHIVDMLLHFAGYEPIDWIMGQVADLEGLDKPKTPAPDSASALLRFKNGILAHLCLGNIGWEIPGETGKWFQFAIEAYGAKGHLTISLNQTMELVRYGSGSRTVTPSLWEPTCLQGLADHLDAAAAYARNPRLNHISNLDHSMMSFQAVMAIYQSACGGGRVTLPAGFPDSLLAELRALRKTQDKDPS